MTEVPAPSMDHLNYLPLAQRCSDEALIEMRQIVKTFKNAAGEFTALNGITTCFYPGEFVSIVGKSGSGKSTLANMITGIDHPTSGTVRIGDTYVHNLSENDMSRWRGRNLGIVFQFFQLMPTLTLLENIMLPMYLVNQYQPAQREKRALELLKLVGLEEFAEKLPAAVSGGQQQGAAIARGLATDPPILIADEPTGNLDSRTAEEIFGLFCGLIDQGKTILMVTHDPALARQTTRTLLLSDGELINPWVATAYPDLSHNHMLWFSHQLKPLSLPPGGYLSKPPHADLGLCIITGGAITLGWEGKPFRQSLDAGEGFSKLDLAHTGWQGITIQACAEKPAELLAIDKATFDHWLAETPLAQTSLEQISMARWNSWQQDASQDRGEQQ